MRIASCAQNTPGLGPGQLGHRGLEVAALAGIVLARRLLDQALGALDLRHHVGQLELDGLVVPDRLAEGAALLRIAQRHASARPRRCRRRARRR
jgi:hypothetical protein